MSLYENFFIRQGEVSDKDFNLYADNDILSKCEKILKESKATDRIVIKNEDEFESILEYGKKVSVKNITDALADIIIGGTVPIKDMIINLPQSDSANIDVRVIVNNENMIAESYSKDGASRVLYYKPVTDNDKDYVMLVIGFYYKSDGKPLKVSSLPPYNETTETKRWYDEGSHDSFEAGYKLYVLWYAIQLALLNPVVRDIIKINGNDAIDISTRKAGKNKKGKRVIKYVKRHEIDINELKAFNESRIYRRSMTLWHVTGHYREYKDGHKIFIKPYWKGADRDKLNNAETVERKIVTD